MRHLVLTLSVACLAIAAIVATAAILDDSGGAKSAGPVPGALIPASRAGTAPADTGNARTEPGVPKVDYMIDLNSRAMTPLPKAIIRSLGRPDESGRLVRRYASSPDGSHLAYVAIGNEGSLQIFTAGIDGTRVRQVTHDPRGAASPAWSPDGTKIAYEGYGNGDLRNLFVFDVATGDSRQITDGAYAVSEPSFTADGRSLVYTNTALLELRTIPVAGGKSTLLVGPDHEASSPGGLNDAGNGSLSPDGSRVTFLGSGFPVPGEGHCGSCRLVANADGTDRRVVPGCYEATPAGMWSPDGRRIACSTTTESGVLSVIVVDMATGRVSPVAPGSAAIWLDRHTLLVQVS